MTESKSAPRRSIAQVSRMLRSIIEAETLERYFWVAGKIDRFHKSDLGHIYFDLVADRSRIKCMLREERAGALPLELRNHLDIEVYGDIHFYEERAETQINVLDLRSAAGAADTRSAIDRLRADGLYPPNKRKPPPRIRRIGVITSRSSRAIGDFESAYQGAGERAVLAPVVWKYVILEGGRAIQSILDALIVLGEDSDIDVIVLIRGGGRPENLAVFDTYELALALAQCKTYTVTGIGHHKDSTLADDVADYAASTPTAVAHYLADLCLRPPPSTKAPLNRHAGFQVGASGTRQTFESPNSQTQADEPNLPEPHGRAASPSPWSNVLILILLVLAATSIALLIAAIITQTQ